MLLLIEMIRYTVVCFCHTPEWNLLEYNRRFIKERSMFLPLGFPGGIFCRQLTLVIESQAAINK